MVWCLFLSPRAQAGVVEAMNEYAEQFMSQEEQREDIMTKAASAAEEEDDQR